MRSIVKGGGGRTVRRWSIACVVAWLTAQGVAMGQEAGSGMQSDPIRCWWQTDKSAVVVGEHFRLSLTCSVIEAGDIKVVPRLEQLDPTAISVSPFDVVEGVRHEDNIAYPWRYFQYEYTLRLIGERFFGQDLEIPPLTVRYAIESGSEGMEGRERGYVLPPLPIRLTSLVPRAAADIREPPVETFAGLKARRFRATAELAAAVLFFGGAIVLFGVVTAQTLAGRRRGAASTPPPLGRGAALRACAHAARRLGAEVVGDGWTPDRVSRALALSRVVAAVAANRPLAQNVSSADAPEREGQVVAHAGWLKRRRVVLSASVTADAPTTIAVNGSRKVPAELQASIHVFTAARYGRSAVLDRPALDDALAASRDAIRQLSSLWTMPGRAWSR